MIAAALMAAPVFAQSLVLPASPESRRISVAVDRGITHTNQLPAALQPLRKAMVGGRTVSVANLRRLADRKDSLAALKLVKLMRSGAAPGTTSDMAFYSAVAAGAGRKGMLDDMIGALYELDPATEPRARLSHYIRVLYGHAWAGNTMAQDAMIALNGEGRLFGPMGDATRARIVSAGGPRLVLSLAIKDLARDDLSTGDLTRVIGYLDNVQRNGDIALQAMAASLRVTAAARRDALAAN